MRRAAAAQAIDPPKQKPTIPTVPLFRDFDRGGDVAQRLLEIDLADDGHAARPRLRVVADVEPLLDMLEDGRRDREIAFRRKPVRDLADVRVDAEDFLNNDKAAAGIADGIGAPGPNRPGTLRLQFDPDAQVDLLPFD